MSVLHVGQIKSKFHEYFDGRIDMQDYVNHPDENTEKAFLSRSLAAFSVALEANASFVDAADAVTDESNDGGIDAVYWDEIDKTLYLAQSKWSDSGTGTIDEAGMLKFLNGVQKLISAKYDDFRTPKAGGGYTETKVYKKRAQIQNALKNSHATVALLVTYTGTQSVGKEAASALSSFLEKHNAPSELIRARILTLAEVHGALDNVGQTAIKATIELQNWGKNSEPFEAYYGQVQASNVASLFEDFGSRLFAPNLRVFLGSTPVNDDLVATALNDPQRFWYFNNGITAICDEIKKLPYGGGQTDFGVFECTGLHIVNGAQTVGSLHRAMKANKDAVEKIRVGIRLISLAAADPNFGDVITKRTNTQNGINKKDFAALDDQQMRLQRELRLEGITYAVKPGEQVAEISKGFDFLEAMTAIACNHGDLNMAVLAKREVSKLWEDMAKPPYTSLVNQNLHGLMLWKLVRTQRMIEGALASVEEELSGRPAQIVIHGNRLIQRIVLRRLKQIHQADYAENVEVSEGEVAALTKEVASRLVAEIEKTENGLTEAYPGNIFKNRDRCADLEGKCQ